MNKLNSNSKIKFLLIGVVIFIWGAIIFRVISLFIGPPEIQYNTLNVSERKKGYDIKKDTFAILVNYRDPFLGTTLKSSISSAKQIKSKAEKTAKTKSQKQMNNNCVWPVLKFGGIIKNNNSDGTTALLNISGTKKLIQEGDIVNNLEIIKVTKDSIIIVNNECKKTFYRNK